MGAKKKNVLTHRGQVSRDRRDKLRTLGLCIVCGEEPPDDGKETCAVCRLNDNAAQIQYRRALKDRVFAAYGGYQCNCCGICESHEFMTIDHIDGTGHDHKANSGHRLCGANLWRWLTHNNFPAGFQVLCYNCNCAKSTNNECPHVAQQQAMLKKLAAIPLTY